MSNEPLVLNWMQVLSDLTRTRLLRLLERVELTVVELCDILQSPQSTVSRHLKVLADDAWVESRRDGTSRWYRMPVRQFDAPRRKLWQLVKEQSVQQVACQQDDQRLEQVLTERQSRSQAFFRSAAAEWDRLRGELFGPELNQWILAACLSPQETVAELGCGTAALSEMISPFVSRVVAIDSSKAMLKSAKSRLKSCSNVDLRLGDLTSLPVDEDEIDLAILVLVLPYLSDPSAALLEAARCIKPSGRVVIVDMVPHERTEYQQDMGHVWLGCDQERLQSWTQDSGLELSFYQTIPPDRRAKGPPLFAASLRPEGKSRSGRSTRQHQTSRN